jgi:hypothetical protein
MQNSIPDDLLKWRMYKHCTYIVTGHSDKVFEGPPFFEELFFYFYNTFLAKWWTFEISWGVFSGCVLTCNPLKIRHIAFWNPTSPPHYRARWKETIRIRETVVESRHKWMWMAKTDPRYKVFLWSKVNCLNLGLTATETRSVAYGVPRSLLLKNWKSPPSSWKFYGLKW